MGKKKNRIIPWAITTALVGAFLIVANVLVGGQFKDIVSTVLGDRGKVEIIGDGGNVFILDDGITDKATAKENGNKVNIKICEEGITLLKNKGNAGLPLQNGAKISIFGKNSDNIAIGGSGSGSASSEGVISLFESLEKSGFSYNPTLKAFYHDNSKSGNGRDQNNSDLDSGSEVEFQESFVGETELDKYTQDIWDSCEAYKDAALVVITRIGGEGHDLPRTANDHSLKLRPAEKALIEEVGKKGFGKVIVLLNTAAAMELGDLEANDMVDAVLWIGYEGTAGMTAVGEVLKGEMLDGTKFSPSGKTVDIYPADFTKDPTWNNFGAALGGVTKELTNGKKVSVGGDCYYNETALGVIDQKVYYTDYEEGIYYGYRYYETAAAENYINYDEAVVYPFGHGLSYTNFSWSLENKSEIPAVLEKDTKMTFKVKVTNTGEYPGRDTVQLYVTPHYNRGGLEKSAKVLVGFAKTDLLQPGKSQTVEISVDSPYAYASYDYKGITGQKGYVVEKGDDYKFTISTDSHNAKEMENAVITASVAANIVYDKDPTTETEVKNLYSDNEDISLNADTQLQSLLSRADFAGTWPEYRAPEQKKVGQSVNEFEISKDWINLMLNKSRDPNPNNPLLLKADLPMPNMGKANEIKFEELSGLPYDDPKWEDFLDQLTFQEMKNLINKGAFQTIAIERLGVPPTDNTDGPVGWVNFMDPVTFHDTCSYCCGVVVASTWNVDRAYDMGRAVGNEGLIGTTQEARNKPYTGWYAPGLNIHRSPFGGRNFEYYSEDPLLSGQYAASVSKGTWSKGVYTTLKHFAVNETETHRSSNGLLTWLNEQSLREIYLKGFEIAVKGGFSSLNEHKYFGDEKAIKPVSVMTSFNRIGERWTGGDYRLNTTILRDEWGFEGLVICDFNTCPYMIEKDMFYSGNDLNLESAGQQVWDNPDQNSAYDVTVMRQCSKNILFVVANSNAVRGDFIVHEPTWLILFRIGSGVVAGGLLVWGVFAILSFVKGRKEA